ncbi:acyltransferase [Aliarcobacter thereius]|uniref:acyltransferase n=1 Tax=Aliarcobacter thereius TaxID=544718 RepID=UPI0008275810|nr:acyltransferase [Aliarcobacter thereius]OCL91220.1 Galactoside O-acetyltransferase [Aliarcobacter thereius]
MFGKNVNLGVKPSPHLYSGYGYIDARKEHSTIVIGDNVWINNNFNICSEGEGIEIGEKTLIGLNFEVSDSDFHDLHPEKRIGGTPKTAKVNIGKNVFIGSNVKILKGVTIGDNSVIANSSVVIKSIPSNVIAGGYPAKVIKEIDFN